MEQQLNIIVQGADNAQIKAATGALNQFYSTPDCVPALMHILVNGQPQLRQIAAVELRKRSMKWWSQLTDAMTQQIKSGLIEIALKDQNKAIRHSVTRIISEVAAIELPSGKWPDLLTFAQSCCVSHNVVEREIGFYLIYALLDVVSQTFTQHLAQLFTMLTNGLVDPESLDVKMNSLRALSKLTDIIEPTDEPSIKQFKALVPHMVAVLQNFVELEDDDRISGAMECFTSVISSDIPVFSSHIPQLVEFFLQMGANQNLSSEVRVQGLSFLMWAILFKKNKIIRLKLTEPLIQTLMKIGCEEEPEDFDEDSPARIAFKVMNTLAANVPPSQVFPVVWNNATSFMQQQPGLRKSAMSSLAAISEGCSDFIRNEFKVSNMIPLIVGSLSDADVAVRRAGLIALASLTTDMGSEVAEFHESLLPLVFKLLGDSGEHIRRVALETLDVLLENLGDNIKPYLAPLMEQLLISLDQVDIKADCDSAITIVSAIGSAAHAAEKDFQPFFAHVSARLEKLMTLTVKDDEELMNVRVSATDAMGTIGIAVGKEVFAPHMQKYMEMVMTGLQMNVGKLPESAYLFFGMMARVFEKDFAPYMSTVVEALFTAAQQQEVELNFDEEGVEEVGADEEGSELAKKYRMNNAIAEEKEGAIDALGEIIEYTGDKFMPYLPKTLQIVQELCDHSSDGVRKASMETLFRVFKSVYNIYHADLDWQAGLPPSYAYHNDVAQLSTMLMDEVIRCYEEEDEMMLVSNLNGEFQELVKLVGPALIAQHFDPLCANILTLLQKKAVCQMEFDEDEAEDEDDLAEYDALLISTTIDLVGTLAQVCGPAFAGAFAQFWPLISKYYRPNKPVSDRSMTIGVMGEVCSGLKHEITKFTQPFMQLVMTALEDDDAEVRSNACYAIGNICMYTQMDLTTHYPAILQKLAPLFSNQPMVNVMDNACGAACRMIIANAAHMPVEQVIPVVLQHMPLKKDFAENEPVWQCLEQLVKQRHAVIMQNMQLVIGQCASALIPQDPVQITTKTRSQIVDIAKQISSIDAAAFQSAIPQLSPAQQQALMTVLN